MGKATSKYEMSRETEAMFDIYKALTDFDELILTRLQIVYGEEQANTVYSEKYVPLTQQLGATIFEDLRYSVWEQLATKQDGEAAIII